MGEPNIYDIDKRISNIEYVVQDLKDTTQKIEQTTTAIEKYISKQEVTNERLETLIVEVKNKMERDSSIQEGRYIELKLENNKQNTKSAQDKFMDEKEKVSALNRVWYAIFIFAAGVMGWLVNNLYQLIIGTVKH